MKTAATQRHVHLDPVGGIAGDMFVAALLDAFPGSFDDCIKDLADSGVLEHAHVSIEKGKSHGIAVMRFCVAPNVPDSSASGNYSQLRSWLEQSALSPEVLARALAIFDLLAQAESQVHGIAVADVHFHEIADWDSVVDIVAAASVIERNSISSWSCSQLPIGSGLVDTQHGKLPVPAPATQVLLEGLSTWDDGESGERVTPTGAAIVKYLSMINSDAYPFDHRPRGVGIASGMGAGQRSLRERPNIVRCAVLDVQSMTSSFIKSAKDELARSDHPDNGAEFDHKLDEVAQLSFAIDDMTSEEVSVAMEKLRQANGVADVIFSTAFGKKGRFVFDVCVLCHPEAEPAVSRLCFLETSTLGVRVQTLARRVLKRENIVLDSDHGKVRAKVAKRPAEHKGTFADTVKVENDDVQHIPALQARRQYAASVGFTAMSDLPREYPGYEDAGSTDS